MENKPSGCVVSIVRLITLGCFLFALSTADAQPAPRVYRNRIEAHWFADNSRFWYRNDNPGDTREFILVDATAGTRQTAFDHESVARQIGNGATADKLPVRELEFSDDGKSITLLGRGESWRLTIASGNVVPVEKSADDAAGLDPLEVIRPSRDGGAESGIVFENQLAEAVKLFWIDTSGNRQPYGDIQPGQRRAQHTFENHVWLITDDTGDDALAVFIARAQEEVATIDGKGPKPRQRESRRRRGRDEKATSVKSPNGEWEAFVRGDNLWMRRGGGGVEKQLTSDANPANSFHRDAISERAIGMNYDKSDYPATLPEVFWSPDSRFVVALQTTVVPEPRVTLVQSSPSGQLQPKVETYPYIKPGDPIPQATVRLFDVESGTELAIDQSVLQNPWNIGRFQWAEDSRSITFLYNQRGHQVMRVVAANIGGSRHQEAPTKAESRARSAEPAQNLLTSVSTRVLIEETSPTFIDYSQKTYLNFLDERGEILWMSERDGWNHLYLFDAATGALKRQLTSGKWNIRRIERVDERVGAVWFWAMGIHEEQDPYYEHLCRLDLGGRGGNETPISAEHEARRADEDQSLLTSAAAILTASDGTHTIQWSPDNRFLIDTWSRVDQPPVHEVRNATNGSLVCRLDEADAGEITATGHRFPERVTAKGRDGETDVFGIIHFPKDFDSTKRYPVIENIYAGPHGAFVPKSFRANYRHQQEIADRGFIVVQIDGMGTNWRGKKFHDVAWKNIRDAGYPDRIAWMKSAGAMHPWMDITRVGVYGGSAGGQNAMRAVLDYPDFYQAAAADCGCHDNRMDKIWWNEAWMGLPGDGSYVKSSNVEDAHKLGGALLLTVGELDKNVDPSSTYQLVGALQKAGKAFEFVPMIGGGHGSAESDFGRKLRADFFVHHLKSAN